MTMARLPKWPKQPKKSASTQTWDKYYERVKAVASKRKAIKDAPKKKDSIAAKVAAIRSKS